MGKDQKVVSNGVGCSFLVVRLIRQIVPGHGWTNLHISLENVVGNQNASKKELFAINEVSSAS